jgi:outer membrane protein
MKMMKTMLKSWLLLALPLMMTIAAHADSNSTPANRIATIDLKKVFDSYYKLPQARDAFEKEKADMDKDFKSRADEAKQALEEYTKLKADMDDPMISETERAARKAKADAKQDEVKSYQSELQTFQQEATDTLSLHQQRMMDHLMEDIQTAINAKAKAAGFSLVIDTSARVANGANTAVVLYSNGENDITQEIIRQLNAAAPPTAGGSTNSPAR